MSFDSLSSSTISSVQSVSEQYEPHPTEHNVEIIQRVRKLNTCWAARTRTEIAMFFILCVSIPFLIAMTVIYITYRYGPPSGNCTYLCSMLIEQKIKQRGVVTKTIDRGGGVPPPRDSGFLFASSESPPDLGGAGPADGLNVNKGPIFASGDKVFKPLSPPNLGPHESISSRSRRCVSSSNYPLIGALLENLHGDDNSEQICKCMAVIISNKIALSSSKCIDNYRKGFALSLRLNSNFWSKGGSIYKIQLGYSLDIDKTRNNNNNNTTTLIALNYQGSDNNFCSFDNSKISLYEQDFNQTDGFAFTWFSSLKLPLRKRSKYSELSKIKVNISRKDQFIVASSPELECANEVGGPLISTNEKLLFGVHLYTECFRENVTYYYADLLRYYRET